MLLPKHSLRLFVLVLFIGVSFLPISTHAQIADTTKSITHRFIFIGDAGRLLNGKSIVSDAVAAYVDKGDSATTIMFLGDNIYEKGLPDKEDNDYAEYIEVLSKQLL